MIKKLFVCLILCLSLCMGFALSASAESYNVSDAAGLLSYEQLAALDEQSKTVSEYYDCGVYIVIVDDYKSYVPGSIADFSEAVYKSYDLGYGEGRNGILLALSMAERDYDLCAYGDWAHYAFTDYGKDKLSETFLDNFRNNDWFGGFNDYIANSVSLMDLAKNGNPLDTIIYEYVPEVPGWTPTELMLIIFVPCLIALGVCSVYRAQMKTAKRQFFAMPYVDESRSHMRVNTDQFLSRNVVRTPIPRNDDDDGPRASGGRPGGTSINSGGFSHKSGKF
ncbi:MAG: TPM domain-containing protein [Oscillospiraceae bacterium]|nr:TPM domain-containing protein [Oscillospiraceae bacterium]